MNLVHVFTLCFSCFSNWNIFHLPLKFVHLVNFHSCLQNDVNTTHSRLYLSFYCILWMPLFLPLSPRTVGSHAPLDCELFGKGKVMSCVCAQSLSHVWLFAAPWTVARQASLSMKCFRQEYWGRVPFPTSGDLPDPGIDPASLMSPPLAGRFFTTSITWEAPDHILFNSYFQSSQGLVVNVIIQWLLAGCTTR